MKIVNSAAAGVKAAMSEGAGAFKTAMSRIQGKPKPPAAGAAETAVAVALPKSGRNPVPELKAQITPPPLLPGPRRAALQGAQARVVAHATTASTREVARAHAHAQVENLVQVRQQAHETHERRYDSRLVDMIWQELKAEFTQPAQRSQPANSDSDRVPFTLQAAPAVTAPTPAIQPAAAQPKTEAAAKAASAVALIEKIEAFVKSQRPGLALTLDGSIGARVEIERLGPREVALRVIGTRGPPAPEDIGRIRDEMQVRGLKVGALSVA